MLHSWLVRESGMRVERIGSATLYQGDARELYTDTLRGASVITDPVWPNCPPGLLAGSDAPHWLLSEVLLRCDVRTVVIVLGFDSDPRFLGMVPDSWPYIRSQQLPYAMPGYRGRLLSGDEMAYVFGEIPQARGIIPGRARTVTSTKASRATGHPCPRADEHMVQLVGWWSPDGGTVVDPFMGTGSTGVACAKLGRPFIGVEIDPGYFDAACERIAAAQSQGRLFA